MPSILIDIELEQPVAATADIYRSRDSCMVDAVVTQLDAIAVRLGHARIKELHGGWHVAAEGLPLVQALQAYLEKTPDALFNPEYSLLRLRLWERMLLAAEAAGVRWTFSAELA